MLALPRGRVLLSGTMTFTIVYVALSLGVPLLTFALAVIGQRMGSH